MFFIDTTVLIGKLSGVKTTPKVEDPEQKKLPKPPKPGTSRRSFQGTLFNELYLYNNVNLINIYTV